MHKRQNNPPRWLVLFPSTRNSLPYWVLPVCEALIAKGIDATPIGPVWDGGSYSVVIPLTGGRVLKITVDHVEAEVAWRIMQGELSEPFWPKVYHVFQSQWLAERARSPHIRTMYVIVREDVPDVPWYDSPEEFQHLEAVGTTIFDHVTNGYSGLGAVLNAAVTEVESLRDAASNAATQALFDVWLGAAYRGYYYIDLGSYNAGLRADGQFVLRDLGSAYNDHVFDIREIPIL